MKSPTGASASEAPPKPPADRGSDPGHPTGSAEAESRRDPNLPAARPAHHRSLLRQSGSRRRFIARTSGLEPAGRLAAWLLRSAVRLGAGAVVDRLRGREEALARRRARVRRCAEDLAGTLGRLKGAFAKAGQFVSVRHDLVSAEVSEPLRALQDRVPPVAFEVIRDAVEGELGRPLEEIFTAFEPEPLGAASIAQVHRARLPDGTLVAVKVQYPWLAASLTADLALLRGLLRLVVWWTGGSGVDRRRLFDEFAAGLAEELDFRREARVAGEIARNLAGERQVVVPRIVAECSGERVLTMTFHDAVRMDDRAGLARLGVEPRELLEILARAYALQVFVDGLFHADPHPGNLFALPPDTPGGGARVLFVDFGLSRHLEPELRRQMRLGLFALLKRDTDDFVARMDAMGMIAPGAGAGVRQAVARMFARIGEVGGVAGPLGIGGGQVLGLKDEAVALLRETPGLHLPNDLLLYAKTLSYLFALGESLDPEVDLVKLTLPYLLRFLAARD